MCLPSLIASPTVTLTVGRTRQWIGAFLAVVGATVTALISWTGDRPSAADERALLASLPIASEGATRVEGEQLVGQLTTPYPDDDLRGLMRLDRIAARSLPETAPLRERAAFVRGIAEHAASEPNLLEQLRDHATRGDELTVRLAHRDDLPVARVRHVFADGGIAFYDFLFGETDEGARVVDFYAMSMGRWQSEVVADLFVRSGLDDSSGVDRLLGAGNPVTDHAEAMSGFLTLVREERFEEALAAFDALPAEVRQLRFISTLGVEAASQADGGARFLEVLDAHAERFPDDPGVQIRLFDAHFARQEWSEALSALDQVRAEFPDPYWLASEAQVERRRGNYARAIELAQRVMEEEPGLASGPDAGLVAALATGDTESARRFARALRDDHGVDLTVMAADPLYAGVRDLDLDAPDEAPAGSSDP